MSRVLNETQDALEESVFINIPNEIISSFQEQWQQSAVLKQMIQRYYRFMQLKALNPPNTLLIPTFDIEIVWQTHLVRPEMYRNDCLRLFRRIIDHSLIIKNNMEKFLKEQAFSDTCQLYEQRFSEKYCSLTSIRWPIKIDIIWRSHMQEPLNYEADCLRLVGYIIYHEPWPIVEDEKMKKSCDQVDQIWKDEFQCGIEFDHLYSTSDCNHQYIDSD